jgi:hypothetical protein
LTVQISDHRQRGHCERKQETIAIEDGQHGWNQGTWLRLTIAS